MSKKSVFCTAKQGFLLIEIMVSLLLLILIGNFCFLTLATSGARARSLQAYGQGSISLCDALQKVRDDITQEHDPLVSISQEPLMVVWDDGAVDQFFLTRATRHTTAGNLLALETILQRRVS